MNEFYGGLLAILAFGYGLLAIGHLYVVFLEAEIV
jgi:hypothetical protein